MKRMTRQRAAILKCIAAANGPLSIDEILSAAEKISPEINRSTVYRNLKVLIKDEQIGSVELPGENVRYETMKLSHHHYFLCDLCNRLFTISGCPKGLIDMVPQGFKLLGHNITLNGFCAECSV